MKLKKEYDLRELLNEATTEERMALAYNILSGIDCGLLGAAWYPGVRFTKEEILNDSLIKAYEKAYPSDQDYQYIAKSYDGEDTWIHYSGQNLKECIEKAYEICEEHVSVEVLAQCDKVDEEDEECILYIGPNVFETKPATKANMRFVCYCDNPTFIGRMRIAEYQDFYRITDAAL